MIVTLKDVAELAGVSRSAVSRTYTEGASVSLKTREKVKKSSFRTWVQSKCIGIVANNWPH